MDAKARKRRVPEGTVQPHRHCFCERNPQWQADERSRLEVVEFERDVRRRGLLHGMD
jgi:hypothetical protein